LYILSRQGGDSTTDILFLDASLRSWAHEIFTNIALHEGRERLLLPWIPLSCYQGLAHARQPSIGVPAAGRNYPGSTHAASFQYGVPDSEFFSPVKWYCKGGDDGDSGGDDGDSGGDDGDSGGDDGDNISRVSSSFIETSTGTSFFVPLSLFNLSIMMREASRRE